MAHEPALSYLLERAGNVFSLAGSLGDQFHSARQSLTRYDPKISDIYASDFDEFCEILLELREAIQNPPDDFAPVAKQLLEAVRIAKNIRDTQRRAVGRGFADFLDFFPDLNTVNEAGWSAIREVTKPWQRKDPFAFVDEPKPCAAAQIDTTPTVPKPPANLIDSAAYSVPNIMANIPPQNGGSIGLVASHLAKRLLEAGHTLAAAHWAVHELVRTGKLVPSVIEVELPSTFGGIGGGAQLSGGKGTIGIPEGRPAPYETFKVVATPSLWTWWRLVSSDHATQIMADCGSVTRATPGDAADSLPMAATDADLTQTETIRTDRPPKKQKRSTERGEGRVKLIAALTKHHKYADGSCLHLEPIGNNELARQADVHRSTASAFFNNAFNKRQKKGHRKYRAICRDPGRLADSLKALNGEFSPHDLYGRRPLDEDDRDEDE